MALSQEQLVGAAAVLLLLFAVILYNNFKAAKSARAASSASAPSTPFDAPLPAAKPVLGRYVQHEGDVVGQVVAEEGSLLLVRKGAVTLAVARDAVREQGADLGIAGPFDRAAAEAAGAAWRERNP